MSISVQLTSYTVAQLAKGLEAKEIRVNTDYQRSPKVWPPAAKSFLIETILLAYPMPKLSFYQVTDLKTRTTGMEIVDGQQRSNAILAFFRDELRLSRKAIPSEASGRVYSELDNELQEKFLAYPLSVDLFTNATKEDIREVFRRINSYQAPLNAEEKRYAKFQGEFKWFVHRLARDYSQTLENVGAFSEKQLNRMHESKLITEIVSALLDGITTTREVSLTKLYEKFDKDFAQGEEIEERFSRSLDFVVDLDSLHRGPLMKPYQLYALLLAHMHLTKEIPSLTSKFPSGPIAARNKVEHNLLRLSSALEDSMIEPALRAFIEAGSVKTNVKDQREKRFEWYRLALLDSLP